MLALDQAAVLQQLQDPQLQEMPVGLGQGQARPPALLHPPVDVVMDHPDQQQGLLLLQGLQLPPEHL